MKGIWICAALLCAAIAMMVSGITLLVIRYQAEAPPEYRDASINYRPRLPHEETQVVVAKDDKKTIRTRIVNFIKFNGGEVTQNYHYRVKAQAPEGVARHIGALNTTGNRLSPGYKNWPKDPPAAVNPREGRRIEIQVSIAGVPYRKLMLDLGASTTSAGAVLTVVAAIVLGFVPKDEATRRNNAAKEPEESAPAQPDTDNVPPRTEVPGEQETTAHPANVQDAENETEG